MVDISPKQILAIRKALGRTQEGMAKIVGVSFATWNRWEKGHSVPLPTHSDKLEKLLKYVHPQEGE